MIRIKQGDCCAVMAALAQEGVRVDSVVTDPPYGLAFMGKEWDRFAGAPRRVAGTGGTEAPFAHHAVKLDGARGRDYQSWCSEWAELAFMLLPPGGHLLAFGGTRTYHRLASAIEDAGFEIRDALSWIYGSGFPKSLNVSRAIDEAAGAEREVVGIRPGHEDFVNRTDRHSGGGRREGWDRPWQDDPEAVRRHHLKTAPATDAARQWDGWGTALKPAQELIVLARKPMAGTVAANVQAHGAGALNIDGCRIPGAVKYFDHFETGSKRGYDGGIKGGVYGGEREGRWPANLVHDGEAGLGDSARFFYCAKASAADRADSRHPTVKPIALLRWLARLVTPPGGTILDPFAGSGTLAAAAMAEGFDAILIEREAEYIADIKRRIGIGAAA